VEYGLAVAETHEPNGFWGLKENVVMRDGKNPSKAIDWDKWANINRQELSAESVDPRFDPTITGPWLRLWPLVHHTKHTKAMNLDRPEDWTKA